MRIYFRAMPLLLLATALLLGCPTRKNIVEGQGDTTIEARNSAPGARALEIVRPDDLLRGPQATGQEGDILIENGEIAVVVSRIDKRHGFAASGGNIVDVGLAESRADHLDQLLTYFDDTFPRQAVYTELAIIDAGGPAKAAVVEARGRDSKNQALAVVTRYTLPAEGSHVVVETTVTNRGRETVKGFELGDAIQWGDARPFAPGLGYELDRTRTDKPWLAASRDGVSYGYTVVGQEFECFHGSGWSDTNIVRKDLTPRASATYERRLLVAEGEIGALMAPLLRMRQQPTGVLTVDVAAGQGDKRSPLGHARVVLSNEDGPLTVVMTDRETGSVDVTLPPGTYAGRLDSRDRRMSTAAPSITIREGDRAVVQLTASAQGRFAITLEHRGSPGPGKLIFEGRSETNDPLQTNPSFGPPDRAVGGHVFYTHTGKAEGTIAPGIYRVTAARGPEFSIATTKLVVDPGSVTRATLAIERVVNTTGWLAGDFHQHAQRSGDSTTPHRDRIISNVGEGLEVVVATDHNIRTDYGPTIDELGLSLRIKAFVGNELTTSDRGHFNAFPLRYDKDGIRGGALNPDQPPRALFAALRKEPPAQKIIQINHPRLDNIGYFHLMELDRTTMKAGNREMSWDFDAVEVFNGPYPDNALDVLADWFAMVDRGGLFVATGNSDTHGVVGEEPGSPRNWIRVAGAPDKLTGAALVSAVKARRIVVSNGPFIEFTVADVGVGGFVKPQRPGARASARIRVQAPTWIDVTTVELIERGRVVKTLPVSNDNTTLRLDTTIPVAVDKVSWFVVRVRGQAPMTPVYGETVTPLAFTNPIWVGEAK